MWLLKVGKTDSPMGMTTRKQRQKQVLCYAQDEKALLTAFRLFVAGYDEVWHPEQGPLEFRVFDRDECFAAHLCVAVGCGHSVLD